MTRAYHLRCVNLFLLDWCVCTDSTARIESRTLWDAYQRFCVAGHHRCCTRGLFARLLTEHGVRAERSYGGRMRLGVQLRASLRPHADAFALLTSFETWQGRVPDATAIDTFLSRYFDHV